MQCEFRLAIVPSKHDGVEHFEPGIALFILEGARDEDKLLRLDRLHDTQFAPKIASLG
jgi:hypothetical protein